MTECIFHWDTCQLLLKCQSFWRWTNIAAAAEAPLGIYWYIKSVRSTGFSLFFFNPCWSNDHMRTSQGSIQRLPCLPWTCLQQIQAPQYPSTTFSSGLSWGRSCVLNILRGRLSHPQSRKSSFLGVSKTHQASNHRSTMRPCYSSSHSCIWCCWADSCRLCRNLLHQNQSLGTMSGCISSGDTVAIRASRWLLIYSVSFAENMDIP